MTKFEIANNAITFVATASVSRVVKQVIDNNTSPESVADVATTWIGAAVIGSVITRTAKNHVNDGIEKMIAKIAEKNAETAEPPTEESAS